MMRTRKPGISRRSTLALMGTGALTFATPWVARAQAKTIKIGMPTILSGRVAQLGKPGPAQQGPQRRIAKRGLVELAEMPVAAAVVQKHGVADVIERRAVLSGRQRTVGGPGDVSKFHGVPSLCDLVARPVYPGQIRIKGLQPAGSKACKSLKPMPTGTRYLCRFYHRQGRIISTSRRLNPRRPPGDRSFAEASQISFVAQPG